MTRESVAQSLESNRKISSLDKNVRDLIHVVKEHGENIRELFANSSSGASKAELLAAMTAIRTERARGNGSGNGSGIGNSSGIGMGRPGGGGAGRASGQEKTH